MAQAKLVYNFLMYRTVQYQQFENYGYTAVPVPY